MIALPGSTVLLGPPLDWMRQLRRLFTTVAAPAAPATTSLAAKPHLVLFCTPFVAVFCVITVLRCLGGEEEHNVRSYLPLVCGSVWRRRLRPQHVGEANTFPTWPLQTRAGKLKTSSPSLVLNRYRASQRRMGTRVAWRPCAGMEGVVETGERRCVRGPLRRRCPCVRRLQNDETRGRNGVCCQRSMYGWAASWWQLLWIGVLPCLVDAVTNGRLYLSVTNTPSKRRREERACHQVRSPRMDRRHLRPKQDTGYHHVPLFPLANRPPHL